MAKFIKHRVNQAADLLTVDKTWGVEIDLRSDLQNTGMLHLAHDPWTRGEAFDEWLQTFADQGIKGTLIVNTKEDGLEPRAIELLDKYKIENYFFLDTHFPTFVKGLRSPQRGHYSCRVSVFEDFPPADLMALIDWVWVDCFGGQAMGAADLKNQSMAARLCMVSPELHGYPLDKNVDRFIALGKSCDFICTKDPGWWQATLREL